MKFATVILAAALALGATAASAQGYKVGPLEIAHPWSRATPKGASVGAGYMKITNSGTEPDRLIGGTSAVAQRFEVHEMKMDGGVMKMRPVSGGLEIKPGETVELGPNSSYHIMFVGLKQPLEKGQHIKGTLKFEKAGSVDVEYEVEGIGGSPKNSQAPAKPGMQGMGNMPGH
ncbi:MAG TPA: copper chaperone PCu(A)C [Xanthobacteraceae bacterium]|jgi:copper(I)-binding protein|nr:copper chaperone PCu(A)C [Xanthobacteraceae bacterium]